MKKSEINKLDKLWSLKIRSKGKCEYCGAKQGNVQLHPHHYFGRRARSTRWSLDNGFCLCAGHHKFNIEFSAHETPSRFDFWAIETRGQKWYDDLNKLNKTMVKDQEYETIRKELVNA